MKSVQNAKTLLKEIEVLREVQRAEERDEMEVDDDSKNTKIVKY